MADRTVSVSLKADVAAYIAGMTAAGAATERLAAQAAAASAAGSKMTSGLSGTGRAADTMSASAGKAGTAAATMGAGLSTVGQKAGTAEAGMAKAGTAAGALESGLTRTGTGAAAAGAGMASAGKSAGTLESGLTRTGAGATAAASGMSKAGTGASSLAAGAGKASTAAAGAASSATKAATATESLGAHMSKASNSALSMSTSMAGAALGFAGMAAAIAAPVKASMDFEAATSKVKATGATTSAELKQLQQAAMSMASTFGVSGTQAMSAVEELTKAGVSAKDILGGGLTGALSLAAAGEMDVGEAAESAASAMTQFGLKGSQVPHVADLFAQAANLAQGSAKDISDAFANVGTVAAAAGMSIEETTGFLGEMANSGIIGAEAGTQVKSMLLALENPSTKAAKVMDAYGIQVYDSSGKMKSFADIAATLQTAFKGTTAEQRNSAMATIAGSYGLQAMNVLYKDGAKTVNEWTKNVSKSGAATTTAKENLDNLKGDLQKLGAVWTNALAGVGSSGQAPLRSLVQSLTELGGVVQRNQATVVTLAKIGVAIAGIGVAAAGVRKGIAAFKAAQMALQALSAGVRSTMAAFKGDSVAGLAPQFNATGTSASRAGRLIKGVAPAAALAGVAFAGMAVAGSLLSQHNDQVAMSSDQASKALSQLAAGSKTQMADINHSFSGLAVGVNSVGEAVKYMSAGGFWHGFRNGFNQIGAMLTGATSNADGFSARIKTLDEQLAAMKPADAMKAYAQLSESFKASGVSATDAAAQFPTYKAALEQTAASLGVTNLSAQQYADWMGGKVPAAVEAAAAAQSKNSSATDSGTTSLAAQYTQAGQLAQALTETATALDKFTSAQLKLSGSATGAYQAISDTASAIAKTGKGLDLNTQKGRDNQKALDSLASATQAYQQSLISSGSSADEASAKTTKMADAYVKSATAAGMSASQARLTAESLGLIPSNVSTDILTTLKGATPAEVSSFEASIKALPRSQQIQLRAIAQTQGITEAKSQLADFLQQNGKKVAIHTSAPGATQAAQQLSAVHGAWQVINGKAVFVSTSAPGAVGAKAQIDGVHGSWQRINGKRVFVPTSAPGAGAATQQVNNLNRAALTTNGRHVVVTASASTGAAESALNYVSRDRTVHIVTRISGASPSTRTGHVGSINANGNLYERHQAQIARAGEWRVWAEPETGGEAYIPLAASKRGRSRMIAAATVQKLGGDVSWFANGSSLTSAQTRGVQARIVITADATASLRSTSNAAASALRNLQTVTRQTAPALKATTAAQAKAAKAAAAVSALQRKKSDYNADMAAKIAGARTATAGKKSAAAAAALRRQKSNYDAQMSAKIAAASAAKVSGKAAEASKRQHIASLRAQKAREDAALTQRINAARAGSKKISTSQAQALRAQKAKQDAALTKQINAAKATAATAKKAAAAAAAKSKAAQEKLKAAQEALADSAKAAADAQKELADAASQAGKSMSDSFRGGGSVADWVSSMSEGVAILSSFNSRLQQLRKLGLSQANIDTLTGMGAAQGSEMASEILKGGKASVDALNRASNSLDAIAKKLGLSTLTKYANGGLVASQATISAHAMFAEAGPESFIPLATAKRSRAIPIWWETGRRLGITTHANGSITPRGSSGVGTVSVAAPVVQIDRLVLDVPGVGTAIDARVKAIQTSTARNVARRLA